MNVAHEVCVLCSWSIEHGTFVLDALDVAGWKVVLEDERANQAVKFRSRFFQGLQILNLRVNIR